MIEKDSSIHKSVGIRRRSTKRDWHCFSKSFWMSERRVWAIFTFPILRCPTIMIKVADTRLVCSDPVITWEQDVKDLIHVVIDCDIGVEKDAGLVGSQLKSSELGPCVLKAGRYEGSLPVIW